MACYAERMMQSSHVDTTWRPLSLEDAQSCVRRLAATGVEYRIDLFVPAIPAPPEGFPVLVVLDGIALCPTVAEIVRRLAPRSDATGIAPTVVVGVGHTGAGLHDPAQRYRDFTAGPAATDVAANRHDTGGADRFLDFLTGDLMALVSETVSVDRSRTSLIGHSLAGYLALHILAVAPHRFISYGAISPSIWWNPEALLGELAALEVPKARVMLAVGGLEEPEGDTDLRRSERRMIQSARRAADILRPKLGERNVQLFVLEDEDHGSVVAPAAVRFLRLMSTDR